MLYNYGFVDRKLSLNYATMEVRNDEVVITDCNDEVYERICRQLNVNPTVRPKYEFVLPSGDPHESATDRTGSN